MRKLFPLAVCAIFLNNSLTAVDFQQEEGTESKSIFSFGDSTYLNKAREDEKAGRYEAAGDMYLNLQSEMLIPANRAKAIEHAALLYRKAGITSKALKAYHELIATYPNFITLDDRFLKAHLELTKKFDEERAGDDGVFSSPQEVIRYYKDYVTIAPHGELAASIRLRIAGLYNEDDDYESAAEQYRLIIDRHRKTTEAGYARVLLAKYYTRLIRKADLDFKSLRDAKVQLLLFQRQFKSHPYDLMAKQDLAKISEIEALRFYNLGVFYLRKDSYRPKAAKRYLYTVLLHYRQTIVAKDAEKLLARLEKSYDVELKQEEKKEIERELKEKGIITKSSDLSELAKPLPPEASDKSKRSILIRPEDSDGRFLLPVENLFPLDGKETEKLQESK